MSAERIIEVFRESVTMPEAGIVETLKRSTVKTGLFKRRAIHVARRFGALKKWADFSNVSIQKLITSFQDTPIYEEGLKEVFSKDLDAIGLVTVLKRILQGEISLRAVDTGGTATPVARVGIERVSMKTDLIPPERMRAVLVESAKARLLNETGNFVCTHCWDYMEMIRIKDLPERLQCPNCGSNAIGMLKIDPDRTASLLDKRGEKLGKNEEKMHKIAMQTAVLIEKYGKVAAIALSARRVQTIDVLSILEKESKLTDNFYEAVMDVERKVLSKRFS